MKRRVAAALTTTNKENLVPKVNSRGTRSSSSASKATTSVNKEKPNIADNAKQNILKKKGILGDKSTNELGKETIKESKPASQESAQRSILSKSKCNLENGAGTGGNVASSKFNVSKVKVPTRSSSRTTINDRKRLLADQTQPPPSQPPPPPHKKPMLLVETRTEKAATNENKNTFAPNTQSTSDDLSKTTVRQNPKRSSKEIVSTYSDSTKTDIVNKSLCDSESSLCQVKCEVAIADDPNFSVDRTSTNQKLSSSATCIDVDTAAFNGCSSSCSSVDLLSSEISCSARSSPNSVSSSNEVNSSETDNMQHVGECSHHGDQTDQQLEGVMHQLEDVLDSSAFQHGTCTEKLVEEEDTTIENIETNEENVSSFESSDGSGESRTRTTQVAKPNLHKMALVGSANSVDKKRLSLPCPTSYFHLRFDKKNMFEVHMNPVYMHDVFVYLTQKEKQFPTGDFMPKQPYITTKMRSILIDWFVEVQESLELNHETIYLAVKICDHYLMKKQILKTTYQLLGIVCLFIACKYDERNPPRMREFLYLCGSVYEEEDMVKLELDVLKRLKFDLGFPLSYRFLRRYSSVQQNSFKVLSQARFILECSLLEYSFFQTSDSLLAAASLLLAHRMLKSGTWCDQVEFASGYKESQLIPTMIKLNTNLHQLTAAIHQNSNQSRSSRNLFIIRKYTTRMFESVATTPLLENEDLYNENVDSTSELVELGQSQLVHV